MVVKTATMDDKTASLFNKTATMINVLVTDKVCPITLLADCQVTITVGVS